MGHDPRGWVWWRTPVVPALGRLRQENCHEFEASLNCTSRPCLNSFPKGAGIPVSWVFQIVPAWEPCSPRARAGQPWHRGPNLGAKNSFMSKGLQKPHMIVHNW